MTTDEELKNILNDLLASGEIEDYSRIEKMLRNEGWSSAVVSTKKGVRVYTIDRTLGEIFIHDINRQMTPEEIAEKVRGNSYGLPHQTEESYQIEGNTIYLRYGADSIGTLLKE